MEIPRTANIWHSPYNVYKHLQRLSKFVSQDKIEKLGKYKPVREARAAAVTALVVARILKSPTYVQIPLSDPPDAYLMQESKNIKGDLDITTLEITSYRANNNESLLEQLKRTKIGTIQKYSDEYILIVELLSKDMIDYKAIREYANSIHLAFPIWTLFGKTVDGSTTAEVTVVNPETSYFEVNIAEEAYKQHENGVLEIIHTIRTGNVQNVRTEAGKHYELPPWEGMV